MQKGLYALFCVFLNVFSFSQSITNLVNNYSGEQYTTCPINGGQVNNANFWFQTSFYGSSDYFNVCATNTYVTIPINTFGTQFPRTGTAYFGICTYGGVNLTGNFAKEYLGNSLKSTLKNGKLYCINYYVSLAEISRFASANIGITFSKDSIIYHSFPPFPIASPISYESTSIISDTLNWIKIEGTYSAIGNENFITMGNFKADANTSTLQIKPLDPTPYNNAAYYYIDDVSVIEINPANAGIKDTLTSYCFMDSVKLGTDSTEFATYQWQSTPAGLAALSCTDCPNPIAKPATTTKYYLIKQQCSATTKDSVTVVVLTPTTQANAGQDKVICIGESIQIGTQDSLKFTSYNWQFAGSLSCTNCAMPFVNPTVSTTYTVQRTECASITSDTVRVVVDDCDSTFTVPNVFTPNYDDVNDTWGINFSTANAHITNFKMNIYDRWGLEVYSTNPELSTPNSRWDGTTVSGVQCSTGVYYYIITFEKNEKHILLKGHLSLFR